MRSSRSAVSDPRFDLRDEEFAALRASSMACHPAGKALPFLDGVTAPALPTFEDDVHETLLDLGQLLLSKHHDYGPGNIARSPGGPLNGLVVRMHDKLARIVHLSEQEDLPNHESLRDSFVDLANYAVIGLLVLDEKWPAA